ncbi:flavin reductase [Tabrizicola sp. TH137]|nr:flavin reductase [Tabrizicola sp. TH137]
MMNSGARFPMWNWNASSIWGDGMDDLRAHFLEGMSRAATFVAVATTDGDGGRAGVTISSLTSVSADGDQPSLLACIHHQSPAAAAILRNRAFCANLLAEDQQGVSDLFAGRAGSDHAARFDRAEWEAGALGQPVLAGATAVFECRLATALLWETHHIIVGRVHSVRLSDHPAALLYGQRAYRRAVHLPGREV